MFVVKKKPMTFTTKGKNATILTKITTGGLCSLYNTQRKIEQ
jgi:hypothetical protein